MAFSEEAKAQSAASLKQVNTDLKKPIKINPEYIQSEVQVRPPSSGKKVYRCCMCGAEFNKQAGNFLSGGKSPLWQGNNGYTPFCKSCGEVLMENAISFFGGNEEHALKYLCHTFDWFYDPGASAMTLSQVHGGKSRLLLYPSKLGTVGVAKRGTTYLDTERADAEAREHLTLESLEDIVPEETDEPAEPEVTPEMLRLWGAGYKAEEYVYLQAQYDDWMARNEHNTKSQEELFKMLAMAQLNVQRAQQQGGNVATAMKAFQDLLGSANLKPAQTAEASLAETNTLGTLIKKWEDTRPIPEPDPVWQDVDGIKRYFDTWFLGHMSRTLNIKNDAAEEYEEELKKYTVEKPTAKHEDEVVETSIFDTPAKGGDGK